MARSPRTKKPLVGLDIEPGSVSAASVGIDGGLAVTKCATVPLEPNVVRDGEVQDVEALSEALKTLFTEHKLDKRVRIGVANQRIVVRTLDVPPVDSPKELDAVVRFSAQDELPMRLDEAVIDFHALGVTDTEAGPRQRVLLVAARRQTVERVLAAVRGAGLRPEGIDLSAFAMVRALSTDDAPTAFLAVAGMTNLAIAQGGEVLFTRVSGSGLEGMAQTLAERRGAPVDEARNALLSTGLEGEIEPGEEEEGLAARSVLVEGVRRLAGEVRASLDFHQGANSGQQVERVVLTGPVIGVRGFVDGLTAELGLPVEIGVVAGAPSTGDGGRYAIAAGLAVEEAVQA